MSTWLTEKQLREDVAGSRQLTLNVAFLQEIKHENPRPMASIEQLKHFLSKSSGQIDASLLVQLLGQLRDDLETHFALEEFYGYFQAAEINHPQVSVQAAALKLQHEGIYLDVCKLVELAESYLYGETLAEKTLPAISIGFHSFVQNFNQHEQAEMELMMRLCNDELGVGD